MASPHLGMGCSPTRYTYHGSRHTPSVIRDLLNPATLLTDPNPFL
jgi:hypothetical protein